MLLLKTLCKDSSKEIDYDKVPTVFTPIENGYVCLSKENAKAKLKDANITSDHIAFTPLDWH